LSRSDERRFFLQARDPVLQREDSADHRDASERQRRDGDLPAHRPALFASVRLRSAVRMTGVELVVPPRRAIILGRAGSKLFHFIVERWPERLGFDRGQRLGAGDGVAGAARRRLAVRDAHVREFDETRQFRERIFGLGLLRAGGAQSPLELVKVDLVRYT
jgi:hypothetical protein